MNLWRYHNMKPAKSRSLHAIQRPGLRLWALVLLTVLLLPLAPRLPLAQETPPVQGQEPTLEQPGEQSTGQTPTDTRRDTRSRRTRRDARERTTDQPTQAGQAAPARARGGQERVNVVRRQGERGGRRGLGGRSAPLPQFNIAGEYKENALYFDPPSAVVREGDRLALDLVYFNALDQPVERIDIWVQYEPTHLEPQWFDATPLEERSDEAVEVEIWREEGLIHLSHALRQPLSETVSILGTFHWRTLAPTPETRVRLVAPAGREQRMMAGEINAIGMTNLGMRPRVASVLRITDADPGERFGMEFIRELRGEQLEPLLDPLTRPRLAIIPRQEYVATGEVSSADVVLINPENREFDELKFRIRYNPDQLTILDADEDNYIERGINIFDGDFHQPFWFDRHVKNEVDPRLGIIEYEVGSNAGPQQYPGGVIARIVFRMERAAGVAVLWFERVDPVTGQVATDIRKQGESLLGVREATVRQALHGARVAVEPLQLSEADAQPVP